MVNNFLVERYTRAIEEAKTAAALALLCARLSDNDDDREAHTNTYFFWLGHVERNTTRLIEVYA